MAAYWVGQAFTRVIRARPTTTGLDANGKSAAGTIFSINAHLPPLR
jgi:hypothetical protein